ncbi:MAG TPA: NUDIX domain-containing protein [Pyrinomonadaceae bacterium]|nr:NUDIX domain-containing protein [Acidobacteriota bacterium]HQZ97654.1 NUDIX domain-containing protein [Pyrinomonadaceae bacterium]
MPVEKVCPIIIREADGVRQILVFRHASAGVQIVKGTLEPGELPADAGLRELAEESGISSITKMEAKGTWLVEESQQLWHFFLCTTEEELKDEWDFFTLDDGGVVYRFFWFDLDRQPGSDWHPVFQRALVQIRSFA